ncbi:LAFA_0E16600g1_1 [Lachancea sp. 'fantastica']|nr:LAFA_0E16600g1_1 [Lachancea sp. 'fantastica']
MAEQITHKRPLRIKLDKEGRKQLHDFYKLEEASNASRKTDVPEAVETIDTETKDGPEADISSIATGETTCQEISLPTVGEARLSELVHAHNDLSSKKAAMNNTIKNTIYENYYDLIKVNELLHSVSYGENEHLEKLKEVFESLER